MRRCVVSWRRKRSIRTHQQDNIVRSLSSILQQQQKQQHYWIHSTFRASNNVDILYPQGLQWGVAGTSRIAFCANPGVTAVASKESLLQAYNRWCFAKDWPFADWKDIAGWTSVSEQHVQIEWNEQDRKHRPGGAEEVTIKHENVVDLLRADAADASADVTTTTTTTTRDLWINGIWKGPLVGPEMVDELLRDGLLSPNNNSRLCYKRSRNHIRIERYYHGYLRHDEHIWNHIWDNLVALDDPQLLEESKYDCTLIGTATLRDWVQGGYLTSRLWVQDRGEEIEFQRPLRNDDLQSSDRRYILSHKDGMDSQYKMQLTRMELKRLRYLAGLTHPLDLSLLQQQKEKPSAAERRMASIRSKLRQNRNKRKFFGL